MTLASRNYTGLHRFMWYAGNLDFTKVVQLMTEKLYGKGSILIRKMLDSADDYALMVKWLSNPVVCEYYEGKTKPLDLEMVKAKFAHRARGESRVTVCIIEYDNQAVGFIQFYPTEIDEYCESKIIDMSRYSNPHGIDIVIGEPDFWNKGIGTNVIRLTIQYLFQQRNADIIFIDPQKWNVRAIRCYEKSGFIPQVEIEKKELHDDEYIDNLVMCIIRNSQPVHRFTINSN